MKCPKCLSLDDKVLDTRISASGKVIRRRRECCCGYRFSTEETYVGEDRTDYPDYPRKAFIEPVTKTQIAQAVSLNDCNNRFVDIRGYGSFMNEDENFLPEV